MPRRRSRDAEREISQDYGADALRVDQFFEHPEVGVQVLAVRDHPPVLAHGHEFREIVYVHRGGAVHEVQPAEESGRAPRARRHPLVPGDCFALAPGERHGFSRPRRFEIYNVLFTAAALTGQAAMVAAVPGMRDLVEGAAPGDPVQMHLDVDERERAVASMEAIIAEARQRRAGFETAMRAHFVCLLIELARAWSGTRRAPARTLSKRRQQDALDAARAFIEEHFVRPMSLDQIAAQAGLSCGHLSTLFKRRFGLPPSDYLAKLRLERAKRLLRTTGLGVAAIARAVGFDDPSYFARHFRAEVGETPRDFRASR